MGCVILESLEHLEPLAGWKPVAERVAEMPDDPDATVWHVCWYQVDEASLRERLPALARAMRPHWYAHFWADDDLCVVLAGRFFWARASDRSTWQEFIAYVRGFGGRGAAVDGEHFHPTPGLGGGGARAVRSLASVTP